MPTPDNVLGVLSLVFWSLMLVVSIKYAGFIMRADNKGEGGIMALTALAQRSVRSSARARWWIMVLGLFGAALFFGDGVITPAISVLSAVEGLEVAAPGLTRFVVPITVVILLGLFAIQSRGTGNVGAVFGPVMCLWFAAIALLGGAQIVQYPVVLQGAVAALRGALLLRCRLAGVLRAGFGGAVHHRRRGAVRRHGSFRQEGRSASPGSISSCRRWSSTTSARAPCCWPIRPRPKTRSTCWCRRCCCFR